MIPKFTPINLKMQTEYLAHLDRCPQKTSDYSFVNLYGWAEEYGLHWAWEEELVWIKQTIPEAVYWAPVGPWESIKWNKYFKENMGDDEIQFVRVPEKLLNHWDADIKSSLVVTETRGHWDYLYSVKKLVALKGNRFHKKKNLLNQFKKRYDFQYIPFGAEMIEKAMAMQKDWCAWRDCESSESLSSENNAISRILDKSEKLKGLTGGAIIVDKEMIAYTVVENLTDDTLLIHFEKGSPDYKGSYQAINQMFLENSDVKYTTVNREQDLDDEGLRKAKLSYHPEYFIKKYRVQIK